MKLRSVILDTTVRFVFDAAIVLSIYFLFAGHNQPGGGFIGGLVAAAAIALKYVTGGLVSVLHSVRVRPWMLLAFGLALACATTLWPLVAGDAPLDQQAFEWQIALLGDVKLTTATIFDTGVYFIVVGLALSILESLGDESHGGADDGTDDASVDEDDVQSEREDVR